MIRKAEKKDLQILVEIVENDGFKHPNKFNLEWIRRRISLGDEF